VIFHSDNDIEKFPKKIGNKVVAVNGGHWFFHKNANFVAKEIIDFCK
jgi:hypothetical protein